jgi:hypothetical protein
MVKKRSAVIGMVWQGLGKKDSGWDPVVLNRELEGRGKE